MISDNLLDNYFIMSDSMDMICIVLKKTIIRNHFCSCCFEKKITDIIFKIPIGPAQSSAVSLKKMYFKTSCLSITVLTLGR